MSAPLWILAGGIALTCLVTTVVVLAALIAGAREDRMVEKARPHPPLDKRPSAADRVLATVDARDLAASGAGRRIREAAGLSLADVATVVGVDASTVFRWESGERRPSGKRALAYREFLGRLNGNELTKRPRASDVAEGMTEER